MPRLSAVLIVHNEERLLPDCLRSLEGLADEVVILDDGSTDRTVEIARAAGARVEHRPFDDFGKQFQAALDLATGDWVFPIDADERVSAELKASMLGAIASPGAPAGYWVRREIIYMGARMKHGGLGDDWVLRLAKRGTVAYNQVVVHPHLVLQGRSARLAGVLDHLQYRKLSEHIGKIDGYTEAMALARRERGQRFSGWQVLRIPWELFNRLFIRGGVLDGKPGVIWAGMSAFYSFVKVAKMWRADDA
ncbi:MAG: glycosyltransferase family 2 protein [Gemmatimonadaceae bacterium]